MSGQTYEYTPYAQDAGGIPSIGYFTTNQATILVKNPPGQYKNIPANAFHGIFGLPDLGFISPQSYDISLVFQSNSNIVSIGNKAFRNSSGLTNAIFPSSLKGIDAQSFSLNPPYQPFTPNEGLSSVTFTDIDTSQLTVIKNSAFYGQSSLQSITLPKSLKRIEVESFASSGLTSLIFDDISMSRLDIILDNAFRDTNLTSVTLPASLKNIGVDAFRTKTPGTLTSVTFYDIALSRLDTIGLETFYGANITTITIPNHIQSIGQDAFYGSNGMTVYINSKAIGALNPKVTYSDTTFRGATGVTINTDPNTYEYTPGSSDPSTEYTGEQTILVNNSPGKIIPGSAFLGLITAAYGPVALVFANGSTTKSIGDDAFKNCTGLKHATIPDSITTIGTNAFTGSGLQKVYISRTTAAVLKVSFSDTTFFGATGVTIVEYPVVTTPPPAIIFPYPKNEKNKRLLGVNQKISSGLARPNFKFQTNQFSAGRSRTAQTKQQANGPVTVIFPIR